MLDLRHWPAVIIGLSVLVLGAGRGAIADAARMEGARAAGLTVDQAVETALQSNPSLAQMRARAQAAAQLPSQAGSLPDPTLDLNALNLPVDSFSLDQEAMTQLQVGVTQAIPFPGKLGLKEEAAEFEVAAAGDDVEETRLQLIREVRSTWWKIFYVERALQIVDRNHDLLKSFVEIAQTKYTVGEGLQQDVLLAQLELSKLMDRRIQLQATRRNEVARLNALLDLPVDRPVRLAQTVETHLPEVLPEQTLYELADRHRPLLARYRNELRAAAKRVDLAERDYLPDFKLGAAYGFRQGSNLDGSSRNDFLSLRLSMTIPLYAGSKQDRAVDQRTSERLARQYALQDERGKVHAAISSVLANYDQAREQVLLFETGIIPQARQTVASMLAGYQVSKVDFLNLVRSQITLYNYETRYWQALSAARQELARLVATVGKEVVDE